MTKLRVLVLSFPDFTDISIIPLKLDFSETPEIVCFLNVKFFQTPAPRQGLSSLKKLKLQEEPTGISKKSNTHPTLAFTLCKVLSGGLNGIF
jgi:hypothetical protein